MKKRSKKLLLLRCCCLARWFQLARNQTSKSFLVLFFKKEHSFLREVHLFHRTAGLTVAVNKGKRRFQCAVGAMAVAVLAGCGASARTPAVPTTPRFVGVQRYPCYPAEYFDTGRLGQVVVRCAVLPDKHVSDCHVLGVEGGDGFAASALAWLAQPDFKAPNALSSVPDPDPGYHVWALTFAVSGQSVNLWQPIAGVWPSLPAHYNGPAHAGVVADCAIDADGRPHDCRIVSDRGITMLDAPALAWLDGDNVRYAVSGSKWPGPRRLVTVPFAQTVLQ